MGLAVLMWSMLTWRPLHALLHMDGSFKFWSAGHLYLGTGGGTVAGLYTFVVMSYSSGVTGELLLCCSVAVVSTQRSFPFIHGRCTQVLVGVGGWIMVSYWDS